MEVDLYSLGGALHSSDGGYKSDKESRDTSPILVRDPLTEKGVESGPRRWKHGKLRVTSIQLGLPPGWKGTHPGETSATTSLLSVNQLALASLWSTSETSTGGEAGENMTSCKVQTAGAVGNHLTRSQETCFTSWVPPLACCCCVIFASHLAFLCRNNLKTPVLLTTPCCYSGSKSILSVEIF